MSYTMQTEKLREELQDCNLCMLSRLSGVPVRTIRRIKNGAGVARSGTIAKLAPFFQKLKSKPKKPA